MFVAIFESSNATTILRGGSVRDIDASKGVNNPASPYGGANPPPNAGDEFEPPLNQASWIEEGLNFAFPPASGLIVRRDSEGRWMDDNDGYDPDSSDN